jgi:hypothetical protein
MARATVGLGHSLSLDRDQATPHRPDITFGNCPLVGDNFVIRF